MAMTTIVAKDGNAASKTLLAAQNGSGHLAVARSWVDDSGNYVSADPFGIRVGNGEISGYETIDKFGHNANVGATLVPIAAGGTWYTKQVGGATQLRVKAGHADDTAAGIGARSISISGTLADGSEATEIIATAGASAGANSVNSYIRVWRAMVHESGSYATSSVDSHADTIVIENAAGTENWLEISNGGIKMGQSQIGLFPVPLGKKAYIMGLQYQVLSSKEPNLYLFQRRNILEIAAPYTARRVVRPYVGASGNSGQLISTPLGPYPGLTDLGMMGTQAVGTAAISVDMQILLMDA